MSVISLPVPLYAGTAVPTGVNFIIPPVPFTGQPISEWVLTDPTTVTLTYVPGFGGTPVVWTYLGVGGIVRLGTGQYYAEIITAADGPYGIKWVGTGACAAVGVTGFLVAPTPF